MGWMCRSCAAELLHRRQGGLDATLLWPSRDAPSPKLFGAVDLVRRLLPVARAGLTGMGVEASEADAWLDVIGAGGQRVTGAVWQRRELARRRRKGSGGKRRPR